MSPVSAQHPTTHTETHTSRAHRPKTAEIDTPVSGPGRLSPGALPRRCLTRGAGRAGGGPGAAPRTRSVGRHRPRTRRAATGQGAGGSGQVTAGRPLRAGTPGRGGGCDCGCACDGAASSGRCRNSPPPPHPGCSLPPSPLLSLPPSLPQPCPPGGAVPGALPVPPPPLPVSCFLPLVVRALPGPGRRWLAAGP